MFLTLREYERIEPLGYIMAPIKTAPERDWLQPKHSSRPPKRRKNRLKVRRATKQRHKRGA